MYKKWRMLLSAALLGLASGVVGLFAVLRKRALAGDAVAHAQHLADLGDVGLLLEAGDLLLQDLRDLGGTDLHVRQPPSWHGRAAAGGS